MTRMRQRLGREEGFTLIELLIVIVIIAILLAIAVPSYLGFRDRANQRAAEANVRAAIPAAEAYYADNSPTNSYENMDATALRTIDAGIRVSEVEVNAGFTRYCISSEVGDRWAYVIRPAIDPNSGSDVERGDVVEGGTTPDPCATPPAGF